MTGFLRARRLLASLRPARPPDPYDPALDPCGGGPEAARRRAITTLIAAMGRHLR